MIFAIKSAVCSAIIQSEVIYVTSTSEQLKSKDFVLQRDSGLTLHQQRTWKASQESLWGAISMRPHPEVASYADLTCETALGLRSHRGT